MNRANVFSGIVCLLIGVTVFWLSGTIPDFTATDNLGGRFMPRLLSILMIVFSLALIVTGFLNIEVQGGQVRAKPGEQPDAAEEEDPLKEEEPEPKVFLNFTHGDVRVALFILIVAVYTWILPLLGYIVSSVLVFTALIVTSGERRPVRVVLGATVITTLLYVLFAVMFNINLPTASLFR
jgi:hypothetical protein